MNPLLSRLAPYLAALIFVIFLIVSIFIFSYVLIFALVVGLVLFVIGWVRMKFFNRGNDNIFRVSVSSTTEVMRENPENTSAKPSGRIIEHDEKNTDQ